MKILGIETSCDETAVCIIEAKGNIDQPSFNILGNALYSQAKTHAEYGGVFPSLAKREHARNLVPLFKKALEDARMLSQTSSEHTYNKEKVKKILEREAGLFENLEELVENIQKPDIDLIAVTSGPGLEPALWVGINFALALGELWNIPVVPTNHMEGHIFSPLLQSTESVAFPVIALLISGGHTELVHVESWKKFTVVGQTRDDAVGEAFDKVARLLSLPYPGGPEISKLAAEARSKNTIPPFKLPRPMIKTDDLDFSFSGIKTAVLYSLKKIPDLTDEIKIGTAQEFENAVTEVLVTKTKKALDKYQAKTLVIGGGVIANTYIREAFQKLISEEYPDVKLLIPDISLSTDNAVMIAMAGYFDHLSGKQPSKEIVAEGNLQLA